jgi:hypothetical protein
MYFFNFRQKINFSFSVFLIILLSIVSITFGTISSTANSTESQQIRENVLTLQNLTSRKTVKFLGKDNRVNFLTKNFNPFTVSHVNPLLETTATFTVTNLNDSGLGSLRQAIADANNTPGDDDIVFQPGLMGEVTLTSGELVINSNITISGTASSPVTITRSTAAGTSFFRIISIVTGATVSISNLTISGGNLTGNGASGGGIYNEGTLSLTNSLISDNRVAVLDLRSTIFGGGIYNTGSLSLTNSVVNNNSANGCGTLMSCNSGASGIGGGIYNTGMLTLTDTSITNNQAIGGFDAFSVAKAFGGGIYNTGTANLINSPVSGNSSVSKISAGGGIYNTNILNLTNSPISGNRASSGPINGSSVLGGGIYTTGNLTILNNTIENNSAGGARGNCVGGGIFSTGSLLTITNSTISTNIGNCVGSFLASYGGGIAADTVNITNSTIAGNSINASICCPTIAVFTMVRLDSRNV